MLERSPSKNSHVSLVHLCWQKVPPALNAESSADSIEADNTIPNIQMMPKGFLRKTMYILHPVLAWVLIFSPGSHLF